MNNFHFANSQEIVTFAIAVIGFLMSLASWIHTWTTQRRKLNVILNSYTKAKKCHIFYMTFENASRAPISITRLFLIIDNQKFECKVIPELVYRTSLSQNGKPYEQRSFYSLDMPINIPSLGAVGGYVVFPNCPPTFGELPTQVTFLLHTNRGKPFEKKCVLSPHASQEGTL